MIEIRPAAIEDFDTAFDYIEKLWIFNTYDREKTARVYREVLEAPDSFAFFIFDGGKPMGFCHGAYFNTFWLCGLTCYVSSIITNPEVRGKGYGRRLMDHARDLAVQRGCKGLVLDSGFQRTDAHRFYEIYGFEKCAHCFKLEL